MPKKILAEAMEKIGWATVALFVIAGGAKIGVSAMAHFRMLLREFGKTMRALNEARDEVRRFRGISTSSSESSDDHGEISER
ncbi:hypothetical protein AB0A77_02180 [Streptomyces varsoviensis]|uniref:hypothetical protein n=1 Tax=Streptomyces varsoviensis TaxID=67373 RepID=UPI0033DD4B8E